MDTNIAREVLPFVSLCRNTKKSSWAVQTSAPQEHPCSEGSVLALAGPANTCPVQLYLPCSLSTFPFHC